jgi:hypothetical protein
MFNSTKRLSQLIAVMLIALTLSLKVSQAHGQVGIVVENAKADVLFGKSVTFTAKITAPLPIKQVSLLFRGANEETTRVETLQLAADGTTSFSYDASLNILPAFGTIVFWYQATLDDGNTYTSPPNEVRYVDNRFTWRENTRANVIVHWYAGDDAFGAAAMDAAAAGMLKISEVYPIALDQPVHVYIYSNVDDLRTTLQFDGPEWAGGHADTQLGIVFTAIAPGDSQRIEMETLIPHELAHVMMYRAIGADAYNQQPIWLLEGFATSMELYPNLGYDEALKAAAEKEILIPFTDLHGSFPADSGSAYQAYAQSESFFNHIRSAYGNDSISKLTSAYSEGLSPSAAATKALGIPLNQLDANWRETVLGQDVTAVALRNLSPYLVLMALALLVPVWGAIDLFRQRRKRG